MEHGAADNNPLRCLLWRHEPFDSIKNTKK
jgi:hypothetical protein